MKTSAKENISLTIKPRGAQARAGGVTKSLLIKHEATAGALLMNLGAPTTPSSSAANGYVPPSGAELAAIDLLSYANNLRVSSSRGIELQLYDDYKIVGTNKIQLVGTIAQAGGALEGEIFTIAINTVPVTNTVVADSRLKKRTATVAVGQTTVNVGDYFTVGKYLDTNEQVGEVKFYRNGVLMLRTVNNLSTGEGDYYESGLVGSLSNQIILKNPPAFQSDTIVAEFGYETTGDLNIIDSVDSLYGSLLKMATDVAPTLGNNISDYIAASPSALDRRAFGDKVLALETLLNQIKNLIPIQQNLAGVDPTIYAQTATLYTPNASGVWHPLANNYLDLPAGLYRIQSVGYFENGPSLPNFKRGHLSLAEINGNNTSTFPPASFANATHIYGSIDDITDFGQQIAPAFRLRVNVILRVKPGGQRVYAVQYSEQGVNANARVYTGIWAERIG